MIDILTKINQKINFQVSLNKKIEDINFILCSKKVFLEDKEIDELIQERKNLESQIIKSKLSFEDKFNDFIYTYADINEAEDIEWFIKDVIPNPSIGVVYGNSGTGKSAIIIELCNQILNNTNHVHVIYIDADMSPNKLKQIGIAELIKKHKERFVYAGKQVANIVAKTQDFLNEIIELQNKCSTKKYLLVEDSLTLLSPKKNGFVDTELLYKHEKQIREAGGSVILIHHLNKNGIFADSQKIEDFADYTFLVERNDFNNCILLNPQKRSRFDIKEKAYQTENRKIIAEIDFNMANISYSESNFIKIIIDLLQDGDEMNQSEIIKYLKQSSYFSKYGVGEKKVINWLEKWAKAEKWKCEQRASEKNAKYYFLIQTEKLTKLPNYNKKEI
ncbi:AAA family ATPase [Aliarcobacter butzleri]|uniref:AAA family ATPase n=1 Tax=Aliarcobacter butzleri TaxID=28197 RepID=UPI00125FD767|nr:AAA family ATPase [Aliarcobacter butzleri]